MKTRVTLNEKGELTTRSGVIIGTLVGITFDLDLAAVMGTIGVEQSSKKEETATPNPQNAAEDGKLFDVPDLVREVHRHYCETVPGKANGRLTTETRRMIAKALDERPVELVKRAITGLAVSPYHRDGGWLGMQYAIGKVKVGEVIGDRIDMMAAKAPRGDVSVIGVAIGTLRTEQAKETAWGLVGDVDRALTSPSAMNVEIARNAEAWLRERVGVVVTSREGSKAVWARAL